MNGLYRGRAHTTKITDAELAVSFDKRVIVTNKAHAEFFKTALEATKFRRRFKQETGASSESWKLTEGPNAGLYAIFYWIGGVS